MSKKNKKPKHHWNYRLILKKSAFPNFIPFSRHEEVPEEIQEYYEIHEVYYRDNIPVSCTENPVKPYGETKREIKKELKKIKKALKKPAIAFSYFENLKDNSTYE